MANRRTSEFHSSVENMGESEATTTPNCDTNNIQMSLPALVNELRIGVVEALTKVCVWPKRMLFGEGEINVHSDNSNSKCFSKNDYTYQLNCSDFPIIDRMENEVDWERAVSRFLLLPNHNSRVEKLNIRNIDTTTTSPKYVTVRHIRQECDWDCGIACLLMTMEWLKKDIVEDYATTMQPIDCSSLRDWMVSLAGTQSIWTVDLVYILEQILERRRPQQQCDSTITNDNNTITVNKDELRHMLDIFSFTYLFSSCSLMVNPSLSQYPYYAASFVTDCIRVQERFATIKNTIQQDHLRLADMIKLIERNDCIAIALVDNSILKMGPEDLVVEKTYLRGQGYGKKQQCTSVGHTTTTYTGHYIILSGISYDPLHIQDAEGKLEDESLIDKGLCRDVKQFCLVIHNPSYDKPVQYLSLSHFRRAWRAEGTDEDIIFIRKYS